MVLGYLEQLFKHLHDHVLSGTVPTCDDVQPPTMASKGPQYTSLDEVESQMADRRRGVTLKPHYVSDEYMEEHKKKVARAAKRTNKDK